MKTILHKLTSIKALVTFWALAMITYIVASDKTDFLIVAQILCAVPLAYIGANVYQKKIFNEGNDVGM